MKPPPGIEKEILEYLHLEYGESADDPDALKVSDLAYEGEFVIGGVTTHFWSYPGGADKRWATVEVRGESYAISTSTRGPRGETTDTRKALRTLRIAFRGTSEEVEPMRAIRVPIRGLVGNRTTEVPSSFRPAIS